MNDDAIIEERKITVRFNEVVQVQEIPSSLDFGPKFVEHNWYSRSELHKMKPRYSYSEMRKMSKVYCNGGECMRGLEGLLTSPKARYLHKRSSQHAAYAVIDEQQMQRRIGNHDPNAIAMVYSRFTEEQQRQAQVLALVDEHYVRRHIYKNLDNPITPRMLSVGEILENSSSEYDYCKFCTCCELPVTPEQQLPRPSSAMRRWKRDNKNDSRISTSEVATFKRFKILNPNRRRGTKERGKRIPRINLFSATAMR